MSCWGRWQSNGTYLSMFLKVNLSHGSHTTPPLRQGGVENPALSLYGTLAGENFAVFKSLIVGILFLGLS